MLCPCCSQVYYGGSWFFDVLLRRLWWMFVGACLLFFLFAGCKIYEMGRSQAHYKAEQERERNSPLYKFQQEINR